MGVIQTSIFAFLLHEQPFERFRFARWQSVVAITLLGICSGLDPNMAGTAPDALIRSRCPCGGGSALVW